MTAHPATRGASGGADAAVATPRAAPLIWRHRTGVLTLDRPLVMGILNLTPDSFSDGGRFSALPHALAKAEALRDEGADILDVGGESTRPGALEVPAGIETERVLPLLEAVTSSLGIPVSIDTRKASVARVALEAGVDIVNDVSGLAHDPDLAQVVAEFEAGLVIMHMRGTPETMVSRARYDDLLAEVALELREGLDRACGAGIALDRIAIDPGLGFAKNTAHNLELLRRLPELDALGRPLMLGPSRKRFLGEILDVASDERVEGTIAACVRGYEAGVRLFRVHDVGPVRRALDVAHAIETGAG